MLVVLAAWLVICLVGVLGWAAGRRDQRRFPRR
jgi:hypothetical protein